MGAATVLFLLVSAVTVCSYHDPAARFRPIVSIVAALFAGGCLAWAAWVLLARVPAHLHDLLGSAGLMLATFWCRGNIARLIPQLTRQTWRSEP